MKLFTAEAMYLRTDRELLKPVESGTLADYDATGCDQVDAARAVVAQLGASAARALTAACSTVASTVDVTASAVRALSVAGSVADCAPRRRWSARIAIAKLMVRRTGDNTLTTFPGACPVCRQR